MPFLLPFAVHISDGLLAPPWLIGGFLAAGLFALVGAWRIREEEIPRVALLTAAFFVASSIRVPIPSGSVHLLLSGLVGVVLGWRAALAIPVGLAMQAILLSHGGATTIGINSCVQVIPALLAWQLFTRLQWMTRARRRWFGAGLVAVSITIWTLGLVFSAALLYDRWTGAQTLDIHRALRMAVHPIVLALAALLAVLGAWVERRMDNAPEFALGLLIGELSVLLAVALKCLVLICGGEQDWRDWALVELVGHLPIAVIEGVVLGFTVGFLTRVKPELLAPCPAPSVRASGERQPPVHSNRGLTPPTRLVLAFLSFVLCPSSLAFAHRLEAEAVVRPFGMVQVETWFETGDSPKAAKVSVFTANGGLLTEGRCDERGIFVFTYAGNEPLRVVVDAGAGHRAEAKVTAMMLTTNAVCTAAACLAPPPSLLVAPLLVPLKLDNPPAPLPLAQRNAGTPLGRLALGVGLLLAIAAAVLVRQRLRRRIDAPAS